MYIEHCLCKTLIYLFEHRVQPDSNNDSAKAESGAEPSVYLYVWENLFAFTSGDKITHFTLKLQLAILAFTVFQN